jgi:hypothetical protein
MIFRHSLSNPINRSNILVESAYQAVRWTRANQKVSKIAVPFEQIEDPERSVDGVWLCGYGYSKIERDKVQIQAKPQTQIAHQR